MSKTRFSWLKFLAVWIGFLLLHFSYGTFPGLFFRIIAEANETVFFHMKMLFVAYSLVSLVEFFIRRNRIKSSSNFFTSRGLIAVAFPWLAITFWLLAWAIHIKLALAPELIFANLTVMLGIYLAIRLEEGLDQVEFRPALKGMILFLYLSAVLVYVSFSLNPPIHFFTTPPE
jgi:hypothetical protein